MRGDVNQLMADRESKEYREEVKVHNEVACTTGTGSLSAESLGSGGSLRRVSNWPWK